MIKRVVEGLLEEYETNDPFELCDYLHIRILIHDMGNKILGFFQRTEDDFRIIHINSNLNNFDRRFICAHELGHAVLHPKLSIGFFIQNPIQIKNKSEINVDKFAAELLIPDNLIKDYEGYTINQIASAEHIPPKLLKLKFKSLNIF